MSDKKELEVVIPKPGPSEPSNNTICSYNKCEGCKALYPIAGVALANCPGCNQPTILLKLTNCPKCNEPAREIRLRVDHVTEKMPHAAICKAQAPLGDSFIIDIVKGELDEEDPRIKNPYNVKQIEVKKEVASDSQTVENTQRNRRSGDCGCKKATNS